MTMVGRELDLDPKRYPARSLAAQISNLKNELVTAEAWADKASNAAGEGARRRLRALPAPAARGARARLRRPDHATVELLQNHPDVAEHYRRRFRHVLVDEYQDTNHAQYMLVRELTQSPEPSAPTRPSWRSSVTPTSRSTPSAARRSATSSSSSATTPTRRRSCSSRTTARRRRSSTRPTPSSRATPTASRRTCGPTPGRARRSTATSPRTSTTRRPGSRSASTSCPTTSGVTAVRRRGVLPHQRAVACVRGGVHPRRPAVQGRRRRAVLRAQARSATRWPTCG